MNTASFALRKFLIVFGTAFSLLAFASAARAQANSPDTLNLKTTAADSAAAAGARTVHHHSFPAKRFAAARPSSASMAGARKMGKAMMAGSSAIPAT
jgi:hypothetical protein